MTTMISTSPSITPGTVNEAPPLTYCNPLAIPNYPVGRACRSINRGDAAPEGAGWLAGRMEQYRELADPSVLWHEGKWYLYPSCDMAWISGDNGATWRHHPLNVRDIGYAPTVVRHRDRFLLLASESELYAASSPVGEYQSIGPIVMPVGSNAPGQVDPMLFSDEDGRLYYYWGCSEKDGIWGVELDAMEPSKIVGEPVKLIAFEPDLHPWECVGEWNQNPAKGWVEGAWMFKRQGRYYLTYSAAGTENRTYAMGCYVGSNPLGPFSAQKRNPILRKTEGLVTGTGHGCVVEGPGEEIWAFYTIRAGVAHFLERRIGMDRAVIDDSGELHVPDATSMPQWAPGRTPAGGRNASPGWLPLNSGTLALGSSSAPNLAGRLAVNEDLRTWWQPEARDARPTLTSFLSAPAMLRAARVVWRDIGMDTRNAILPGPFRYRIEAETPAGDWVTLIDRMESTEDLLVDYRECPPTVAGKVRLVIAGWPPGITPAVVDFTVFGEPLKKRLGKEGKRGQATFPYNRPLVSWQMAMPQRIRIEYAGALLRAQKKEAPELQGQP